MEPTRELSTKSRKLNIMGMLIIASTCVSLGGKKYLISYQSVPKFTTLG